MGDKSSDLVQGTLDMLVLKTLDFCPHRANQQGRFSPECWLIIPRDSTIREGWAHRWRMEADREQQASQILPSDREGAKETNNEKREWGRQVAAIVRILEAS